MADIKQADPEYPTIRFLVRHGEAIAQFLGVVPIVIAIVAAIVGAPWWCIALLVVIAPICYLAARSYMELVRLIADMLLPRF